MLMHPIALLMAVLMAKRGGRRKSPNFVVLKVSASLALGALANDTVITATLLDLNDDLKIIGVDLTWNIGNYTLSNEGPVEVGLSTNAYTVTQILEAVDASPSSRSDEIALERSARRVRHVGVFPLAANPAGESLNDGKPVRSRRLYWPLSTDRNVVIWGLNRSGAALTTGAVIDVQGKVYAKWT